MKIGMNISIDVTKLNKEKFFQGKNGAKYANLSVFIDTEQTDRYGNHASVSESQSKEERESNAQKNYVGNGKVYWTDWEEKEEPRGDEPPGSGAALNEFDDDIPF